MDLGLVMFLSKSVLTFLPSTLATIILLLPVSVQYMLPATQSMAKPSGESSSESLKKNVTIIFFYLL